MNPLSLAEASGAATIEALPAALHQQLMDYLDNNEAYDFDEADPNSDREDG